MKWDWTHGSARGAYLAVGDTRVYIKQIVTNGVPSGAWKLFVDGELEGVIRSTDENTVRAAGESILRTVQAAKVAAAAAAA